MLHTDSLAAKYGPIRPIVLRHDHATNESGERIREVELVDASGVVRTYALTFLFDERIYPELNSVDREIMAGGMIGETFRKHGYSIDRREMDDFIEPIPEWLRKRFKTAESAAVVKLIAFYISGETTIDPSCYAMILEVNSPDFLSPDGYTPTPPADPSSADFRKKLAAYFARSLNR
jgi:hypothetical protein